MKRKFGLIIIQILFFLVLAKAQDSFYKRMEGNIGGQGIQLHITKEDSEISILYYYQIIGIPVKLSGFIDNDRNFTLHNYDDSGKINETYSGSFTQDFSTLAGMWFNIDSSVKTTFQADEIYPEGSKKINIKTIRNIYYNDSNRLVAAFKNRQLYIQVPENALAQKAINDTVIKWQYGILPKFNGQKPRQINFERYGHFFIDSSKAEAAKMEKEGVFGTYTITSAAGMVFNEQQIACVELYNYMYIAGAHPAEFVSYSCFNTQNGKLISLDDMFKGKYVKALTKQADKVLRLRFDVKKKNLKKQGFLVKKISLNDNFYLTPQGIIFFYNQYEIAPYVFGSFPIFISYASIKDYIREDGPLRFGLNAL